MARRRQAAGFRHKVLLFWLAPLIAVILTPLYLHVVVQNHSQSFDDDLFVLSVLFAILIAFSIAGCVLDAACRCSEQFPHVVLLVQVILLFLGILLISLKDSTLPANLAQSLRETISTTRQMFAPVDQGSLPVVATLDVEPAKVALPPVQVRQPENMPVEKSSGLKGWQDVGDGYCIDGTTNQEFNSLHSNGKTLQECADVGASDKYSVALDFTAKDGGCDVRYPTGFLAPDTPGYEWWGWGIGEGNPVGSGKTKHDTETRCYKKFILPTTPPPPGFQNPVVRKPLTTKLHPYAKPLAREYCFRNVQNEFGELVNIILVRAPWQSRREEEYFDKFKDELLFIGISSLEDFPLPPPNPFSPHFPRDKYVGLFPGFLNMYRNPEKTYPSHVKTEYLSQSDFSLPGWQPPLPKIYDFTFSGTDQDVDNDCVGWSSFCKNWTFVVEALEIMCGELDMRGVLVATKNKADTKACKIPASCNGKMKQTLYISQDEFHHYVRQSKFLLVPQVHDASPRVVTQALALDVPVLMNRNLIGGWKYRTDQSGEFFNDIHDFKESAQRLLRNIAAGKYSPRKYVTENYGDDISGRLFFKFIDENFRDRVKLPERSTKLYPVGA